MVCVRALRQATDIVLRHVDIIPDKFWTENKLVIDPPRRFQRKKIFRAMLKNQNAEQRAAGVDTTAATTALDLRQAGTPSPVAVSLATLSSPPSTTEQSVVLDDKAVAALATSASYESIKSAGASSLGAAERAELLELLDSADQSDDSKSAQALRPLGAPAHTSSPSSIPTSDSGFSPLGTMMWLGAGMLIARLPDVIRAARRLR